MRAHGYLVICLPLWVTACSAPMGDIRATEPALTSTSPPASVGATPVVTSCGTDGAALFTSPDEQGADLENERCARDVATETVQVAPAPTPTPIPGAEPSGSPTPAVTNTPDLPPFTATPAQTPSITYFAADRVEAAPGDHITLSWTTVGGVTARLIEPVCCASNGGNLAHDVPPNGSLTLTLDAAVERDTLTFILSVSDGASSDSRSIRVRLPCPDMYFFTSQLGDLECPSAPAESSPAAEQVFERGRMIWIESQDKVYVLFEDGQPNAPGVPPDGYFEFEDTWEPGQPESDPELSPPAGLYQPIRGFGMVWRAADWVRDGLGWALALEQAFDGIYQRPWQTCLHRNVDGSIESCSGPSSGVQYLRAADGRLIRLAGFGALGRHSIAQWEFWSP